MADYEYLTTDELESVALRWEQPGGTAWDLSSGWTFSAKLVSTAGTTALTKTSGITGYNGTTIPTGFTGVSSPPNVVVDWSAGELAAVTAGGYLLYLSAVRSADSKQMTFRPLNPPTVAIITAPT